jgi:hypothetical protein
MAVEGGVIASLDRHVHHNVHVLMEHIGWLGKDKEAYSAMITDYGTVVFEWVAQYGHLWVEVDRKNLSVIYTDVDPDISITTGYLPLQAVADIACLVDAME